MRGDETAIERLTLTLADAVAARIWIPCARGDLWTSDDPSERQDGAELCSLCPATAECRAAGEAIKATHGVWGGIDMTRSTTTRKAAS